MFKSITYFAEEVDLHYNDRILIYCTNGFSYWYRGKEKSNNDYCEKHHRNRFDVALKKHSSKECPRVNIDYLNTSRQDRDSEFNYFKRMNEKYKIFNRSNNEPEHLVFSTAEFTDFMEDVK